MRTFALHALRSPLRWPLAFALAVAGGAHIPVTGEHLREAPYMGWLFVVLAAACAFLAVAALLHDAAAVYVLSIITCGAAVLGYAATRLIAFPMLADDVGNWLEPLGIVSIVSEGIAAAVAVLALGLSRRHCDVACQRRHPGRGRRLHQAGAARGALRGRIGAGGARSGRLRRVRSSRRIGVRRDVDAHVRRFVVGVGHGFADARRGQSAMMIHIASDGVEAPGAVEPAATISVMNMTREPMTITADSGAFEVQTAPARRRRSPRRARQAAMPSTATSTPQCAACWLSAADAARSPARILSALAKSPAGKQRNDESARIRPPSISTAAPNPF